MSSWTKIYRQLRKNASILTKTIDFSQKKPTILYVSIKSMVQNIGFIETMFAISDSFLLYRKREIMLYTHNDFMFFLIRKTNQRIILLYEIKGIENVCYLILHRNKNIKRQYGKIFDDHDMMDGSTLRNRLFYL
jgi:hypothetical protein